MNGNDDETNNEDFMTEVPDEAQIEEELSAWLEKIKKWLKAHPGKTLKDALKALKGKAKKEENEETEEVFEKAPTMNAIVYAMKKAGVDEGKIRKTMTVLRDKYPYPYPGPGKAEDDALEYVIREEMNKKMPSADFIADAIKKAGGDKDVVKKTMRMLRKKYSFLSIDKEENFEETSEEIEKLQAENKALKEDIEKLKTPVAKSEQTGEKTQELSEDERYAIILKGLRGD